MKRTLILLVSLGVAAFLVITGLRWRSGSAASGPATADAARQRIRDFWAVFNTASSLRTQGRYREAAETYRKCLELDPRHEDSLYYLATSLHELGEYDEAVRTLRRMTDVNPESGRAYSQLGNTLSTPAPGAPQDFDAARKAYQRNIEVNKEQAGPFLRLGMLDLNEGKLDDALAHFRVAGASGAPEAIYLVAYTLFLQGKQAEAIPFLRKVLAAYGTDKKITGKGVLSEGDLLPGPGKALTALERAGLRSIALLCSIALRAGGYPAGIAHEFHVPASVSTRGRDSGWAKRPVPLRPGGRAAWADADKDGWPDLFVAGGKQPAAFYHNQRGALVDATQASGLGGLRDVWDTAWGDYDADGALDLYLMRGGYTGGESKLYRNELGHFSEVTPTLGFAGMRTTARALFSDLDGDGRPELVEAGSGRAGQSSVRLFRNTGARFVDRTREAGLFSSGTAVDVVAGDYDRDGKSDLLVLFWQRGAVLYRNLGNGEFSDTTSQSGLRGTGGPGYSALFLDYDQDGWLDILTTVQAPSEDAIRCLLQPEFRFERNTPRLYRNQRNGTFLEGTRQTGLDRSYGTMQAVAADLDSDGWVDVLFANGSLDAQRVEPSVVLRNNGGKRFEEWYYVPGFGVPANSIGAAVADCNRDGLPDIYLASHPVLRGKGIAGGLFVSSKARTAVAAIAQQR